jgi:hypothetical protein
MIGYVIFSVVIVALAYYVNELRYHKYCSKLIKIKNRPYVILVHEEYYFNELRKKFTHRFNSSYNTSFSFGYSAGFSNTLSPFDMRHEMQEKLFSEGQYNINIICELANGIDYEEIPNFWHDVRFYKKYPIRIHTDYYSVFISDPQYLIKIIDTLQDSKTEHIMIGYLLGHLQFLFAKSEYGISIRDISIQNLNEMKTYIMSHDNEKLSKIFTNQE